MIIFDAVMQPSVTTTLEVLESKLAAFPVSHMNVAAAYVTSGGVRDLINSMELSLGPKWPNAQKKWLVAFDYCRSEPVALAELANLANSKVKIHDAANVIKQNCIPIKPFHPKTFIFKGGDRLAVLSGSGNISRSGLNKGFEAGLYLEVSPLAGTLELSAGKTIGRLNSWFKKLWSDADPLTADLLKSYNSIYESAAKLNHPTPTEDDILPAGSGANSLGSDDLLKLRVCRHLWIEAGKISRNLGRNRPGNQLMMKRLSRVFFGVPATDVPENSPLRRVDISFNNAAKSDCSLTFSDNGMDKLTLPIPGAGGPVKYDNEVVLFTRLSTSSFSLNIASAADKLSWAKKSNAIGGTFSMAGGRKWGVF